MKDFIEEHFKTPSGKVYVNRARKFPEELKLMRDFVGTDDDLTAIYCILNQENLRCCKQCGKGLRVEGVAIGYKSNYCSISCSRRGEEFQQKRSATLMKRFGVPHPMQSKDVIKKYKKTCLKNNGVDNPAKSDRLMEGARVKVQESKGKWVPKMKETKYNKWVSSLSPETQRIISSKDLLREEFSKNSVGMLAEKLNISHSTLRKILRDTGIYSPKGHHSTKPELKLFNFFKERGYDVKLHDRSVIRGKKAYEIDIFFPEHKIGVEVDGIYWHSFNPYSKISKPLENPYLKIDLCRQVGVKLLRFTDLVLDRDFEAVTKLIMSALSGAEMTSTETVRWWSKYNDFQSRPEDDEERLYKERYRKYIEFTYGVAR